MRQVFLWSRAEVQAFVKGEPFIIRVGSGEVVEMRYDRPVKHTTAGENGAKSAEKPGGRRVHPLAFKKKVATFARAHAKMPRAAIARKFGVSESLVHQWKKRHA